VHTVSRPSSDLDDGAAGPRLIRRILRGSALPDGDLATALRRAGRAGSVRRRGVAAPRPGQRAAKQPAAPKTAQNRFLFPMSHRYALPARPCIGRSEPRGFESVMPAATTLRQSGQPPASPGCPAASSRGGRGESGLPGRDGRASRTCFPSPGVCYVKDQGGIVGVTPIAPGWTPRRSGGEAFPLGPVSR
jgi:hypothetical protein